jgi:hypothetical protein
MAVPPTAVGRLCGGINNWQAETLDQRLEMTQLRDNIDTLLAEKMLQLELPTAQTVRIPEGEAPGFTPRHLPRTCYHIEPQKE